MAYIMDSLGAQCWVNLLFVNQYKEIQKTIKESTEICLSTQILVYIFSGYEY